MRRAYAGRPRDDSFKQQLEAEMNILRAWDNYERGTSDARELAKQVIAELLSDDRLGVR